MENVKDGVLRRRGGLRAALLVAVLLRPAFGQVIINEIMYHPAGDLEDEEWIELYNAGATTVTLTGRQLTGAIAYVFPVGKTIGPGGYLVVAKSVLAFEVAYPTSTADVIGDYAGQLDNAGESILLYDAGPKLIDAVAYDDEGYWPPQADGDGPSLELINPRLDNSVAQSWAAAAGQGTPGLANSRYAANPRPFLVGPRHAPAVPQTSDTIAITVYGYDDVGITSVSLFYRKDPAVGPFTAVSMLDDGGHGDGAADDGVFGALLSPQTQGTILEFWIRAVDSTMQTTDIPATAPLKNFLLQVDKEDFSATTPTYRLVMKEADHYLLHSRPVTSNELLNATFICDDEIFYNVGVRFRGKGSRTSVIRYSYRVQFTEQEPFRGVENLNLNAQWIRSEYLNMDLLRRAGIPAPATRFAHLVFKYRDKNTYYRYDGEPVGEADLIAMGWRVQMQDMNKDFLRDWFPGHFDGNLYRGVWCSSTRQADFTYYGLNENDYRCPYDKKTNEAADDYWDVMQLCDVFTNTPDAAFTATVQEYIDAGEWARFWACLMIVNTPETNLYDTRGDDYFMYFDPATSPPAAKMKLMPWDLDQELNFNPTQSIYVCQLPRVRRFSENPDFTPSIFYHLQDLLDHYYTWDIVLPKVDALAPYYGLEVSPVPGDYKDTRTLDEIKSYVRRRREYLESLISRELVVNVVGGAVVGDQCYTTGPTVTLNGRAPTAWTRWVTVNGNDAGYQHRTGNWGDYPLSLSPGTNTAVVECLTTAGLAVTTRTLSIHYLTAPTVACGTLAADTTWSPAAGPCIVTCDVVVPIGRTLEIEPGTVVVLQPGKSIIVYGTLLAEGTAPQPIRFAPMSTMGTSQVLVAAGATWRYHDRGRDLGTTWTAITCDDTGWSTGPAELGYGDGDEATSISWGGVNTNRHPCYYFRRRFDVPEPGAVGPLRLRVIRDDGCVVYLNGVEVARSNMPVGTISYGTWASVSLGVPAEATWQEFSVDPGWLEPGTNVIAVEVHQALPNSNDVSFNLALSGGQLADHWGVIAFKNAAGVSRLAHCEIEGGSSDQFGSDVFRGMVSAVNSSVEIEDCRFGNYRATALVASGGGGTVRVRRCEFDGSEQGCIRADRQALTIEDCTFAPRRGQAAVDVVSLHGWTGPESVVRNCMFGGTLGNLLALSGANATVERSRFQHAADAAVRISSGSQCLMDHNVVRDCERGVVVRSGSVGLLDHNTLYAVTAGISSLVDPAMPGLGGGATTVTNTIVWGGARPIEVDGGSVIAVRYSDVQGGYGGASNFSVDPQFVNAVGRDLRLRPTSPCRNGGEGGTYVGAFPGTWVGLEVHNWRSY